MKYTLNENILENLDNQDVIYFLGFVYADGNNFPKANKLTINLKEDDIELLEKFRVLIGSDRPIRKIKRIGGNRKNQCALVINNKKLSADLTNLGVVERKTNKLTFPNWLKPEMFSHFIRGYFDGDGCVTINKKGYLYFSLVGTEKFLHSIQKILNEELNVAINKLHTPSIYKNKESNIKFLIYGTKQSLKIRDWLYKDANTFLKRKYNKFKTIN